MVCLVGSKLRVLSVEELWGSQNYSQSVLLPGIVWVTKLRSAWAFPLLWSHFSILSTAPRQSHMPACSTHAGLSCCFHKASIAASLDVLLAGIAPAPLVQGGWSQVWPSPPCLCWGLAPVDTHWMLSAWTKSSFCVPWLPSWETEEGRWPQSKQTGKKERKRKRKKKEIVSHEQSNGTPFSR